MLLLRSKDIVSFWFWGFTGDTYKGQTSNSCGDKLQILV